MNTKQLLLLFTATLFITSCIKSKDAANYKQFDIKFIVANYHAKDSLTIRSLFDLVKPIKADCNETTNYLGYDGHIQFVKIGADSVREFAIQGYSSFFERHWLGEPAAEKKTEEITKALENIQFSDLNSNLKNQDTLNLKKTILKYLQSAQVDSVFILNGNLNTPGISSMKTIEDIKKAIAKSDCKKTEVKPLRVIVIVAPGSTDDKFSTGEPEMHSDNEQIKQALLILNRQSDSTHASRKAAVDKIIATYFADRFVVNLNFGTSSAVVTKPFENGRDYLEQLTINRHLHDIIVTKVERNGNDKVTMMNIVEIQKQDIPIQTK